MALSTRGLGRPREAVLNRDLIMQTALRLLDEQGEQSAGIREIARDLGVRPSALYNHISGQDDLIDGVRELVSDRIDVGAFESEPWNEAVRQWAHSYRSAFAAHPPTIAMLAVRPLVPGSRTSRMYDAVCRGLASAGWPEDQVLTIVVALECFILGAALDDTAPADMLDPGDDPGVEHFTAAYQLRSDVLKGARPSDLAFEFGLEAMISGLQASYAQLRGEGSSVGTNAEAS